jgi:hypothetical protein
MPLGDDVEQGPDLDPFGPLGEDGPEQDGVGDDLITLVLEVMLGEPEAVVTELLGSHAHVQHPFLGVPDLRLTVVPVRRRRGACSGVFHLHASKEEEPGVHPIGTPFERLRVRRQTT